MTRAPSPDHYSYSHYAEPSTASSFDERRFGGPIGEVVATAQARVLRKFLGDVRGCQVLDVGTGTGRAALLLARRGAHVTAVDASDAMLAVARQRAAADGVVVRWQMGDAHALEFPDRSFDAVVCLRVLMHTPGWRECIGELCRVSRRIVVVDFPSATSVAVLQSLGRRLVHAIGFRTEPYRVFRSTTVADELLARGFRVRAVHRQFVLPIALHKAVGSPRFTAAVENILNRIGLLGIFGSPVSIAAKRCASS